MKSYNLKHRSYYFSIEAIRFLENLPKNYIYQTELKQIIKKGDFSEKEEKFIQDIEKLNQSLELLAGK